MATKDALIQITLDEADEPVLSFTHQETNDDLAQQLLGKLIRQLSRQGVQLHLVRQYPDAQERPIWHYHIRAQRDETDQ